MFFLRNRLEYEDVPSSQVVRGAEAFQAFAQGFFTAFPESTFTLGTTACSGHHVLRQLGLL
jgi:hypothetical protein